MTGLLLFSGGQGSRLGTAKHGLAHPAGGTWGGHLVRVFEAVCPGQPVCVLGDPLPDQPGLPRMDDPREGPGVALRAWCAGPVPDADRWWLVACDQVRWTPARLATWITLASTADPANRHWVVARHAERIQPLGSLLPAALRPALAAASGLSLLRLVEAVPHLVLDVDGPEWRDVDTPEELREFQTER